MESEEAVRRASMIRAHGAHARTEEMLESAGFISPADRSTIGALAAFLATGAAASLGLFPVLIMLSQSAATV